MDFIKDFTITNEDGSQIKIEGEIPFANLTEHRSAAIKALGQNIEIDGFRKGHVPEEMVIEKIGEMNILTEMAERALANVYPEVVKSKELKVIGHPQIQITKIATDNPLGFTATVAIIPEITLPDYKSIAHELNQSKESDEVTEEEIDNQVKDILRQKIAYERMQAHAAKKAESEEKAKDLDGATELPTPDTIEAKADSGETEKETHTHADGTVHEGPAHGEEPDLKAVTDDEIPELTDELVKTLGQPDQFETVADFKAKLKEHLEIEKKQSVAGGHRAKITDTIIEGSDFILPQILIDSEISQMYAQMNEDLTRANLKIDDYLTHIKKTKEELEAEWTPAAEKRARLQLVLNEIAVQEKTTPDQGLLDAQVDQLMEQYKDADETRVRVYVASVMTNEAVMKLLEDA